MPRPRLTPDQRSLRGQIAAETRWGNTPRAERIKAAERGQTGLWLRFEREVDPDGTLPPQERAKRAANLRRAHMARVALASSRARAARRAAAHVEVSKEILAGETWKAEMAGQAGGDGAT